MAWDNVADETGYKIERSLDGVIFSQIDTVGVDVVTYNDTGLSPSTLYYYRVRAYNANGDGSYSNITSCTTFERPASPAVKKPVLASRAHKPGLVISVEDPLWFSARTVNYLFRKEIDSYQHELGADGGYLSCQFTLKVTQKVLDEWLENGIGRHIVVYSGETELVWEGCVNKVLLGIGALSATRGPLFDIANRVTVTYTPILDADVDPIVTGSATETPIAEDSDSQDRYGIIEKIVNGGKLLDDGVSDPAEEIRDMYLAENKVPFTDEAINLASLVEPTMTIECVGYSEWLKAYVYNDYTPITVTLDSQIKNVLDADPNSIFSTDQSKIEENALLVNELEDSNRFANTVIQDIVAQGDASDNRWVFGTGKHRLCYYRAVPTEVEYLHSLTSSSQNITLVDGTEIMPWNMRAGVWVEIVDFMVGSAQDMTDLRNNTRVMFAERVTFTAPHTLAITGGKISTLAQRMKQLGAGGA